MIGNKRVVSRTIGNKQNFNKYLGQKLVIGSGKDMSSLSNVPKSYTNLFENENQQPSDPKGLYNKTFSQKRLLQVLKK